MSLSDIDCMGCLVNMARGLDVENDLRVCQDGVNHVAVWGLGPGRVVAACEFEDITHHNHHVRWRRKRTT